MTERILLIGAGALGSRHLQSLASAPWIGHVTVVEPSAEAAAVANTRWQDVPGHETKQLVFSTLDELASQGAFDAAVIATPSAGRLALLQRVLDLGVKRILCEKVLFQSVAELDRALELATAAGADVRVNHIYRYVDAFKAVRAISQDQRIDMTVDIDGDGMACNLIHYVDLFAYLAGGDIEGLEARVDQPVHASKRGNKYVEFTGTATARNTLGSTLRVTYHDREPARAPRIVIRGPFGEIVADEALGTVQAADAALAALAFEVPRVSGLTAPILVDQREGRCLLPSLAQSTPMNRQLLETFNRQLTGTHAADQLCPIT